MNHKLTIKEQKFISEYTKDWNGAHAAIRAGYAPRSAKVTACQMLRKPEIASVIEPIRARYEQTISEEMGKFEPLINRLQASGLLGFNVGEIRRMAAGGVLPAYKINGAWRFRISELDRWLNERRQPTPELQVEPTSDATRKEESH